MFTLFKNACNRLKAEITRSVFKTYKYYGLHDLDRKLEPYLNYDNGFFVECGANDGLYTSNTAYFEKHRGWKGLLIEPIPDLFRKCQDNRPAAIVENYALVGPEFKEKDILIHTGAPWIKLLPFTMAAVEGAETHHGGAKEHVQKGVSILRGLFRPRSLRVPATPLSDLLDKHKIKEIDLFSLDVEGFEYQVLTGLDLSRFQPKWILLECNTEKQKQLIDALLRDHYEQEARLSEHDFLYRLRSVKKPF